MGVGAGLYMCDVVKKVHVRYLISWWVLVLLLCVITLVLIMLLCCCQTLVFYSKWPNHVSITGSWHASSTNSLLTYKVFTSFHPPYLHNLISVQPPCITRSSSLVTLTRPPTSFSSHRSFRCASPCLWNQLPSSLCQPHSCLVVSYLPVYAPTLDALN